jgi:hypothetical protein
MAGPAQMGNALVASFPRPPSAKAAIVELERVGVSPEDIRLLNELPDEPHRAVPAADDRKIRWIARRWLRGAVVGAPLGGLVFVAWFAEVHDGSLYPGWIGAAVGGAAAGMFVCAFIAVGSAMPRNPQAWDTHLMSPDDTVRVAVQLHHANAASPVSNILRRYGASSVDHLPAITSDQPGEPPEA